MHLISLREPVSAWSHGAWALLSLPAAMMLWRRACGDRGRQLVLVAYALCLGICGAASMLYHAVRLPDDQLSTYLLCDHIGIYLLIAGTYTPIAWTLMRGRWRIGTLSLTWLAAAVGVGLHLAFDELPCWLTTGLYLALGWGSILCYVELLRIVSYRTLLPITVGGVLYSVWAIFHTIGWPVVWAGVIGAHEVFHFLVVAASLTHFGFMLRVVAPWGRPPEVGPSDAPTGRDRLGSLQPKAPRAGRELPAARAFSSQGTGPAARAGDAGLRAG